MVEPVRKRGRFVTLKLKSQLDAVVEGLVEIGRRDPSAAAGQVRIDDEELGVEMLGRTQENFAGQLVEEDHVFLSHLLIKPILAIVKGAQAMFRSAQHIRANASF